MQNYMYLIDRKSNDKQTWLIAVCVLLSVFTGQIAAVELKSEIIEAGYYQSYSEFDKKRNLQSPTGYVRKDGEVKLVKSTTDIPASKGQLFGFKFLISGFNKSDNQATLNLVVKHPVMIRPNGSQTEGYGYPVVVPVVDGVVKNKSGYKFDNEFEMVKGEWRFQYWVNKEMVVEQIFNVREPTEEDLSLIEATNKIIQAQRSSNKNTNDKTSSDSDDTTTANNKVSNHK